MNYFDEKCPSYTKKKVFNAALEGSLRSSGLVTKILDSHSRGPRFKITGWLQGWLTTFHPSKVN